jgi:hypothetical protein
MSQTTVTGKQIKDASVQRDDLDSTTTGQAVVRKITQGTNITLSSTGVDSGTGDVTINVDTNTIATKTYVDNAVAGTDYKEACKYATTAALPAVVYSNGSSGVGATLTGVSLGALSIDSSSPAVNDRILVKDQVDQTQNGIYKVTATGSGAAVFVMTRAVDFDQSSDIQDGDATYILSGTVNGGSTWVQVTTGTITLGSTNIVFSQVAGPGSILAGSGISVSGLTISVATGGVTNAMLAGSIAYSKLSLTGAILNTDLAGSIAYSKLSLTGAILNADLAGSITATKLVGTDIATVGTITSGTWNGAILTGQYGGTGVANTGKTITLANNLITSGNFALTLTQTATTNITLPTTGTLATLDGVEILTNKVVVGINFSSGVFFL